MTSLQYPPQTRIPARALESFLKGFNGFNEEQDGFNPHFIEIDVPLVVVERVCQIDLSNLLGTSGVHLITQPQYWNVKDPTNTKLVELYGKIEKSRESDPDDKTPKMDLRIARWRLPNQYGHGFKLTPHELQIGMVDDPIKRILETAAREHGLPFRYTRTP